MFQSKFKNSNLYKIIIICLWWDIIISKYTHTRALPCYWAKKMRKMLFLFRFSLSIYMQVRADTCARSQTVLWTEEAIDCLLQFHESLYRLREYFQTIIIFSMWLKQRKVDVETTVHEISQPVINLPTEKVGVTTILMHCFWWRVLSDSKSWKIIIHISYSSE